MGVEQSGDKKPKRRYSAGDIVFFCLVGLMFAGLAFFIYECQLWKGMAPADPIQIGEPQ